MFDIQVVTFTAAFISYPWDTVRRRLMMQAGRNDVLYRGVWHCTTVSFWIFNRYFRNCFSSVISGRHITKMLCSALLKDLPEIFLKQAVRCEC